MIDFYIVNEGLQWAAIIFGTIWLTNVVWETNQAFQYHNDRIHDLGWRRGGSFCSESGPALSANVNSGSAGSTAAGAGCTPGTPSGN